MASIYNFKGFSYTYSGLATEDFDDFCQQFDAHALLYNFASVKQITAFQTRLKGNALIFFNSIPPEQKGTLEDVKQALKKNFEGDSWKWHQETKLLSRKQLSEETLDDYVSDIMKLSKQLGKSPNDQISIFVRGLLPSIRAFVFSKEPKTMKEAIENARLGVTVQETAKEGVPESIQTRVSAINSTSDNSVDNKLDVVVNLVRSFGSRLELLEKKDNNSNGLNQFKSTQNSRPDRPRQFLGICFRCGRRGHRCWDCRAIFDIQGNRLN